MPLARIDLPRGKSAEFKKTVGEVVYEAMIKTINVPANDRFQIFTEHGPESLIIDRTYLGIERSAECMIIQVVLTTILLGWLFLRFAKRDQERQELLDWAAAHGIELSNERAARAAIAGTTGRMRERLLEDADDSSLERQNGHHDREEVQRP